MRISIVVDSNPVIAALIGGVSREIFRRKGIQTMVAHETMEVK